MLHELLMGLLMVAVLVPAKADDIVAEARAGQDLAETLLQQSPVPTFVEGGERQQGAVVIDEESIPVNQIVPGGDRESQLRLTQLAGDEDGLNSAAQTRLVEQAGDPGDAATVLRDLTSQVRTEPKAFLAEDQFLLQQSVGALTAPLSVAPEFPACATHTQVTEGSATYTTFRERTCETIHRPTSCTRTLSVEDLSLVDETFFDQQISVDRDQQIVVSLRDAFPQPTVILAANLQLTWTGPAADVSMIEPASPDNDWHTILRITHDPDSCQTCVIRIAVRGSVRALRQNIDSDPENCLLASDEFCTAAFTCQDDAPRLIGDSALAPPESFLLEPIYPGSELHQPASALAPVCYRATARYECRIRSGEFCIDSPGGSSCSVHQDNEGVVDTCTPMLEAHPECTLSRSGCTESGIGHGDWCYVESHTYRCPESMVGPSVQIHTTQPCSGQIRCAGDDCLDQRFAEHSIDSVADGMAGMMIAQTYASDWQAPADPNRLAPVPPRLFPGKPYECRKALGGTIDCCDQTETNVESEWFARYQRHLRRANATDSMSRYASAGPHGSWKTLAESRSWSLDQLSRELTSGPETVSGGDNPVLDPDDGSIVGGSRLLQPMNDEFRDESRFDHMAEVGWACSVEEFDLANQRELGHCLSIGSYCHHQVLGACLDKRDVFCCFNSAASRTLRETIAGPDGAARGAFGTARNPQCEGVAVGVARVQSLDITDLKGRLARAGVMPSAIDVLSRSSAERLTGSGSNLADSDRSTVQQRTQDRLGQILGADVRDALHAEGVAAIPSLTAHDHAGQLSFAPAYLQVAPGRVLIVSVLRQGSAGEISVQVVPGDGGQWPVGMPAINETLSWTDGQDGFQQFSLTIPRSAAGSFVLRLTNPSDGAVLYPNDQATVKLVP